jgi:hypothetical protein
VSFADGVVRFALELDVAAERDQGDAVVGVAALEAEEALPETEREDEHPHPEGLGHEEMAGLVEEDDDAENDDEGDGRVGKTADGVHQIRGFQSWSGKTPQSSWRGTKVRTPSPQVEFGHRRGAPEQGE